MRLTTVLNTDIISAVAQRLAAVRVIATVAAQATLLLAHTMSTSSRVANELSSVKWQMSSQV
jgi:hypothetical protein